MPFAAPAQGKPHKGFATFSFSSRLGVVSHLDTKFGNVQDKRLPQFIHGSNVTSAVSLSDRRGELSGWGLTHSAANFRSFGEAHPGSTAWGLGHGNIVGCPNVMDLSTTHGMAYGEATPGGYAFYLAANDKRGKFLSPFLSISDFGHGIPRISQDLHSVSSIWIAKTQGVPHMTKGLVGILAGSSSGVVSAYSVGTPGGRDQRLDKGELTARWLLSPGVPIVHVIADDHYSIERNQHGRFWSIAVNALGEVFYLARLPTRASMIAGPAEHFESNHEVRAWQTGHSVDWCLVPTTQRSHKPFSNEERAKPTYLSSSVFGPAQESRKARSAEIRDLQSWMSKASIDFRAAFESWNMQRKIEVDFDGDDGNSGG